MLQLAGVAKSFFDPQRGEIRAIDGITATVPGGVLALVGANGAGKSTVLRLIATLLVPDRGTVLVDGLDTRTHAQEVRGRLGYLSSTTRLYPRLTGRELMAYGGGFFGLTGERLRQGIREQCARFGMDGFIDQRIDAMSTGQLQRVNLARTLLAEPSVLILDEPTTGLDIVAAWNLVEAVKAARRPGRLIILATHILPEVEQTADRLWVLREGRLIFDGTPAQLGQDAGFASAVHGLLSIPSYHSTPRAAAPAADASTTTPAP
jgi:sodium transport system ATP-binding protein